MLLGRFDNFLCHSAACRDLVSTLNGGLETLRKWEMQAQTHSGATTEQLADMAKSIERTPHRGGATRHRSPCNNETEQSWLHAWRCRLTRDRLEVAGVRASRPQFGCALAALQEGDTLVITKLERLGRSTHNMLAFVGELRGP